MEALAILENGEIGIKLSSITKQDLVKKVIDSDNDESVARDRSEFFKNLKPFLDIGSRIQFLHKQMMKIPQPDGTLVLIEPQLNFV